MELAQDERPAQTDSQEYAPLFEGLVDIAFSIDQLTMDLRMGPTLAEIVEAIKRRDVSPVEIVETCLERIATLNPSLNAVVTVAPDVMERARDAEAAMMRRELQIVHQDPFASLNPTHTIEQILTYPLLRHRMVNGRAQLRPAR